MTKKRATKTDGESAREAPDAPSGAPDEAAQAEVVKRAGRIDVMDPAVRKRAEDEAARSRVQGKEGQSGARRAAGKRRKP